MIMPPVAQGQFSMYVPLFIYPNWWVDPDNYSWTPLINAIKDPMNSMMKWVIAINIDSGPGSSENTDYSQHALIDLRNAATESGAELIIIGYVWTNYGNRNPVDIDSDIDNWFDFYGSELIDGIFFDEVTSATGHEAYYQSRINHANAKFGGCICWGNPGNAIDEGYVNVFDTMLIAETDNASKLDANELMEITFNNTYPREKFAAIVHSQSSFDENYMNDVIKPHVGYYYATDDVMPNPYDTFPTYLTDMINAMMAE